MGFFALGLAAGILAASVPWWIKVRGLNGVVSDLKDAVAQVKKV